MLGVRQSRAVQGNSSRHDQVAESTTVSSCSRKQFATRDQVAESTTVSSCSRKQVHDTIKLLRVRQSRAVLQGNSSRHESTTVSCSTKQFTLLTRVRQSRAVQGNSSRHDQVAESTTVSSCSRKQFTTRSSCREYDSPELFKETVHDTIKLLRVRQSRCSTSSRHDVQGNNSRHDQVARKQFTTRVRQSRAVQGTSSRHDQVAESTTVSSCSRKQFTTRSSC